MSTTFRSQIRLEKQSIVDHRSPIVTAGSCFADNLGEKLRAYKWNCLVNPFGTQFHPLAIFDLITRSLASASLTEELFLESDGASYHYYLPRTHYAESRASLNAQFLNLGSEVSRNLHAENSILMLTFGTAFIHELSGSWVSNCHQQPGHLFTKRLLTLPEMQNAADLFFSVLPQHTRVIVTLSPVRHLREGLEQNSLSKSLLRVFSQYLVDRYPDRATYFPAYEIMMDDLRDYRFYKDDLTHPADLAVQYIWELFQFRYLTPDAQALVQRLNPLLDALRHRSLRPDAPSQKSFQRKLLSDLRAIEGIDLAEEIRRVEASLKD